MMRTMRENTKWIMLVTALAFVALMVFEWGMDATGRSSAGPGGNLGSVNGEAVVYDDYNTTYRNLYDQVQQQQEDPITSQQNRQIEDAAWNQVVTRILVGQELERRGIQITDEEIQQAARFSPPPEFRQSEFFQTDGQFDLQKYQDYLASASVDRNLLFQLEAYYRDVLPRMKLMRQLERGLYISDSELWRRWQDIHEKVRIRYLPLTPERLVPDSAVSVSQEEIEEYYETNKEEFATPARAHVRIAVISQDPTPADTTATLERVEEIRQEILEGVDFAEVAVRESDDPGTAESGGDLGTFGRGDMVPAFEEVAFDLPVGEVSEPVLTGFGYHLIKVEDRRGDSIQARHILVPVERTEESEIHLLTMADSLEALGEDMPLTEASAELGIETREVDITADFPVVQGVGRVGEGSDWIFEERPLPGEVSPVFETQQAFYALELIERTAAGYQSLEEASPTIRDRLELQRKMDRAEEIGMEIVDRMRAGTSMDDVAVERSLEIRQAGPFARTEFVQGVGRLNAAIGTAFGLEEGEVSEPVRTEDNVFILQLLERIPADSAAWEAQKEDQRARTIAQLEQQRADQWLAALKEEADIVDRREEVLRPADEEQQQGIPMGTPF